MKPIWGAVLLVALSFGIIFTAISCKKDDNPAGPGPTGADLTINIVADAGASSFGADPETVTVNQTVSWHNLRGITHTATASGGPVAGQWNTGNIAAGATSTPIIMDTAGSYPYACLIHSSMTGTLVVLP